MSLCSLIITKQPIDEIGKDRYHKHILIYEHDQDHIYVYSRMFNNILVPRTRKPQVLPSYYQFLLSINQISPIFVVIGDLIRRQSELDLAMEKIKLLNDQAITALNIETPIEFGRIYFIS
ncbi:hypothetical protein [Moraxella canis]|uniref:Uncharacterized protein n=1 Tax=Moraxella canis TaxID=90239 RepID=A0A1S9ZFU1_9GAMM|nr:hypothetical protein [Moraxella canis]OOR82344.1 hypothetical protein B0180_09680 [Moraxella canis]